MPTTETPASNLVSVTRTAFYDTAPAEALAAKAALLDMLAADRPHLAPVEPPPAATGDARKDVRDGLDHLLAREVSIALEKAGVLAALAAREAGAERRVVWEIGAWGPGQAVALKCLFPDLRYVLTDRPESLLRVAQAVMWRLPEAKFYLHTPGAVPDWGADVLFFPIDALADFRPPKLDLALSVLPLRRFGTAFQPLAETAGRLGAPYLYVYDCEGAGAQQSGALSALLSENYWLHRIPVLDLAFDEFPEPGAAVRITEARDKGRKSVRRERCEDDPGCNPSHHIVGWPRWQPGSAHADPDPAAVIALLLYNHGDTLPECLDSLCAQTRRDFVVLLVDDGSSDATEEICRRFTDLDPRFVYHRDGQRRGYPGNARHALALARAQYPDAPFFAWGSDHDLYHPLWFEAVAGLLETDTSAVLAWTESPRIDANGDLLPRVLHRFEAVAAQPMQRFRTTLKASLTGETVVGNMIYGLFRANLFKTGVTMPTLLLPDRVVILEAALAGRIRQVPAPLWYRRYEGIASRVRQRRAMVPGRAPAHTYLPVWLTHCAYLAARQNLRVGAGYAAGHLVWHSLHRARMYLPQVRRRVSYRVLKPAAMVVHRARKRVLSLARGGLRRLKR